jgi:polyisoprenoid-binding protein YceI
MSRTAPASRLADALVVALAALCLAADARAAELQVDPAHSTLLLRVWKQGAASVFAHDHVARATRFKGTVRYDPARPEDAAVAVEAEAGSVVMDEPNYRSRLGLPPIADVNRREIQNTMRGPKQLDVATYPTISFRSQKVGAVGEGKLRVTGLLALHGQSREVTLAVAVDRRGAYLHATTSFRFLQSDFGITPYSFGNAVSNRDEVELQIELLAK